MKNYQRSILISVGILAVMALGYFVFTNDNKQYDWSETYAQNEKQPYDTYVISEMLKSYFPKKNFKVLSEKLSEQLPLDREEPSNYIYIGNGMYTDSLDEATLLEYVEKGNRAFVSATELPYEFIPNLYKEDCTEPGPYYFDDVPVNYEEEEFRYWSGYSTYHNSRINLQFTHPDLAEEEGYKFVYTYRNKERKYFWRYIDDETFCENAMDYDILGRIGLDSMNFIRIKYGEGYFFIHTTPMVFTNYQMIKEDGLAYAGKVFSHLPEGDIFWDEGSKYPDFSGYSPPRTFTQSPLQYILSQKSLKWSWYTGLVLVLLYVLFRAKRRQRIIPILPENTNTSLEYIRTIGRLYYQQNAHKKLAQQEMKLFLYYLRDHFNIPTQNLNDVFIQKVAVKSEVPADEIKKIIKNWKKIEKSPSISEHTLIYFHGLVDDFYRNSK